MKKLECGLLDNLRKIIQIFSIKIEAVLKLCEDTAFIYYSFLAMINKKISCEVISCSFSLRYSELKM